MNKKAVQQETWNEGEVSPYTKNLDSWKGKSRCIFIMRSDTSTPTLKQRRKKRKKKFLNWERK